MRLRFLNRLALTVAAALAISACGSSSSGPGRINVRLMDGPSVDYVAVNLDIQEVQIHQDGGWLTLGTPDRVVDLLTLVNGVTTTLVTEKQIEAGHYTQMRLVLGPDNTVVLAGEGSVESRTRPLVVPSGQQSGVKLNVNFDVQPDTTVDVVLDMDAARSVFVHRTGASEKYMLRPVVSAVDVLLTGSISGVLTDAVTGAPLPDVEVTAQSVAQDGAPVLVRSARTNVDGTYLLPYLPAGGSYHVVAQPIVAGPVPGGVTAYRARASGAFLIVRESPTATWNAAFDVSDAGSITGTIDPARADSQVDTVYLAQALETGGGSFPFIVQTTDGVLATGETYAFSPVPVGAYTAWVTRRTVTAAGDETLESGPVAPEFTVQIGVATPVDLDAPGGAAP